MAHASSCGPSPFSDLGSDEGALEVQGKIPSKDAKRGNSFNAQRNENTPVHKSRTYTCPVAVKVAAADFSAAVASHS